MAAGDIVLTDYGTFGLSGASGATAGAVTFPTINFTGAQILSGSTIALVPVANGQKVQLYKVAVTT